MKNNLKYIFLFVSVLFLNNIASATKTFKEDFEQEQGLKILNNLYKSFNDFQDHFNAYKPTWYDQFKTLAILKNRIGIALESAKLTKELEEKWDSNDTETISPRKIQKTMWENSKIHLIPYTLYLFESDNLFGKALQDLTEESREIFQRNSEELIKSMEEKGDVLEKKAAVTYFKYKALKENIKAEMISNNSQAHYFNDLRYKKYESKQKDSFAKIKEFASVSKIENLPVLNYDEIFNNLIAEKFPLYKELIDLKKLADEMIKIFFKEIK